MGGGGSDSGSGSSSDSSGGGSGGGASQLSPVLSDFQERDLNDMWAAWAAWTPSSDVTALTAAMLAGAPGNTPGAPDPDTVALMASALLAALEGLDSQGLVQPANLLAALQGVSVALFLAQEAVLYGTATSSAGAPALTPAQAGILSAQAAAAFASADSEADQQPGAAPQSLTQLNAWTTAVMRVGSGALLAGSDPALIATLLSADAQTAFGQCMTVWLLGRVLTTYMAPDATASFYDQHYASVLLIQYVGAGLDALGALSGGTGAPDTAARLQALSASLTSAASALVSATVGAQALATGAQNVASVADQSKSLWGSAAATAQRASQRAALALTVSTTAAQASRAAARQRRAFIAWVFAAVVVLVCAGALLFSRAYAPLLVLCALVVVFVAAFVVWRVYS